MRSMTLCLACGLVLYFGLAMASAQNPATGKSEIERMEQAWNDAHVRGDADALDKLWADDLEVAVPKMPVMRKAELISFVRSGRMKFQRYDTSDVTIRLYGGSAVVTGRLHRKRTINGREVEDDWRFTKTYIHGVNSWRVVSFHASESAPDSK